MAEEQESPSESFLPGRGELVLVVDDEEPLREVIRSALQTNGYHVLTAGDGTEGLTLFLQHRNEVRLVITDVTMPFLDGLGMVRAIRRVDPGARIVASSGIDLGEGADGPRRELAALGVVAFLQKPYLSETLLRLVREMIDAPPNCAQKSFPGPGSIMEARVIPAAAPQPAKGSNGTAAGSAPFFQTIAR